MPRILLLLPTTTYRSADFLEAAAKLGVEVAVASEEANALEAVNPAGLTPDKRSIEDYTLGTMIIDACKPYRWREHWDKIRAAQPTVPMHIYPAGHGFNCDERGSYHASSSKTAWERTLEWLKRARDKLTRKAG